MTAPPAKILRVRLFLLSFWIAWTSLNAGFANGLRIPECIGGNIDIREDNNPVNSITCEGFTVTQGIRWTLNSDGAEQASITCGTAIQTCSHTYPGITVTRPNITHSVLVLETLHRAILGNGGYITCGVDGLPLGTPPFSVACNARVIGRAGTTTPLPTSTWTSLTTSQVPHPSPTTTSPPGPSVTQPPSSPPHPGSSDQSSSPPHPGSSDQSSSPPHPGSSDQTSSPPHPGSSDRPSTSGSPESVTAGGSSGDDNTAAYIGGGVTAAIVLIVAIVVAALLYWRYRNSTVYHRPQPPRQEDPYTDLVVYESVGQPSQTQQHDQSSSHSAAAADTTTAEYENTKTGAVLQAS